MLQYAGELECVEMWSGTDHAKTVQTRTNQVLYMQGLYMQGRVGLPLHAGVHNAHECSLHVICAHTRSHAKTVKGQELVAAYEKRKCNSESD